MRLFFTYLHDPARDGRLELGIVVLERGEGVLLANGICEATSRDDPGGGADELGDARHIVSWCLDGGEAAAVIRCG
jgi:hypothetical protein